MRHDVSREYHPHEVAGVSDGRFARAEQIEQIVEEIESQKGEHQTHRDVQQQDVAQNMLGGEFVALPETYRRQRGRTHSDHRAERRGQIHERHCEGQPRYSQRAHAVTDKDAVDHVVE